MGEYYNIEDANGQIHRVLVTRSIQFTPYERELTVTSAGARRLADLPLPLHVAPPTPYRPRAIIRVEE